jgi:hypothetical protein
VVFKILPIIIKKTLWGRKYFKAGRDLSAKKIGIKWKELKKNVEKITSRGDSQFLLFS